MKMTRIRRTLCLAVCALTLLSLASCGAQRGRTEHYDGYTVRTEKTASPAGASQTSLPERAAETGAEEDYVLNRKSMKFHYPDCSGAGEIKEQNRWDYHGTRQSVIDMGYAPCRICNP